MRRIALASTLVLAFAITGLSAERERGGSNAKGSSGPLPGAVVCDFAREVADPAASGGHPEHTLYSGRAPERKPMKSTLRVTIVTAIAAILASNVPAGAKVIYTPVNVTIENSTYNVDLNNDSAIDFTIVEANGESGVICKTSSGVLGAGATTSGNGVAMHGRPLAAGSLIRSSQSFFSQVTLEAVVRQWGPYPCGNDHSRSGAWLHVESGFLGLAFAVDGKTHYGWAQLSVACTPPRVACLALTATLMGYAYETKPGKSILAGQM
jgi:hypothetical protein